MGWASGEAVGVLTFLLPGFVAAGIFYSLTSYPKPAAFDRIVLALIFTVVAQAVTEYGLLASGAAAGNVEAAAAWGPALSVTVAVLLGLGASCLSNTDALHGLLRRARVTRETSHPTEWYSTFARYGESCCVVLHLQGERRLYGFAEEWPGNPTEGHFRISDAEWLADGDRRIPVEGVSAILIPATEVTMIEFLPFSEAGAGETA